MGTTNCECDGNSTRSQVDVDTCFKLLSSSMCRQLLRELANQPDHVAYFDNLVDSYAESVAEDVERERVRIRYHHNHLPALEDAGIIEFDETSGDIRYYPDEKIETLLDVTKRWTS